MTKEVKVLVIDDSAFNRQTITSMLEGAPGIRVIGRAGDGDEGLKQVFEHEPDVITLDLEMPRMDGFTFLRILMSRRPTPVIVISSYARRENVFKALELGALDFIAKPTQRISAELRDIEKELCEKVRLVAQLRMVSLAERERPRVRATTLLGVPPGPEPAPAMRCVVVGASTGGPPALQHVFAALEARLPACYLIAQHMPPKFTQAFAERLDRGSPLEIREAKGGDLLTPGLALVAPGGAITTVERTSEGHYRVNVDPPDPSERHVPSIDRLLESAAKAFGAHTIGVVLTGMGFDGRRGIKAVKAAGGRTIAEAAETAVVFGMPDEAIRTGAVDEIVPLGSVAKAISRLLTSVDPHHQRQ